MSTGQQEQTSVRNCVSCGRSIAWDANVCPFCGHDFRQVMSGQSQKKSFKGSLLILILLIILCWPAAIIYFLMKWD